MVAAVSIDSRLPTVAAMTARMAIVTETSARKELPECAACSACSACSKASVGLSSLMQMSSGSKNDGSDQTAIACHNRSPSFWHLEHGHATRCKLLKSREIRSGMGISPDGQRHCVRL